MKRLLDIVLSLCGLAVLFPLFIIVAALIRVESRGPVLFLQERMGRNFRPFMIYKFRTMRYGCGGPLVTVKGDVRITRMGGLLRKFKIDELPQLLNVLKGDMSFVGPRPEVRKYAEMFEPEYRELLKVRPGITDPSSVRYSEEEREFNSRDDWEDEYVRKILPEKIRLSLAYVRRNSVVSDLKLIFRTILKTTRV